jgi:protein-tyrosine phosphatase
VIDLHCHVLPAIDDGPRTMEETLALARIAAAQGTTRLVATPHVSPRYPTSAREMQAGVDEVNDALKTAGLALDVLPGAEIAPMSLHRLDGEELSGLRLGGGPFVLLEAPLTAVGPELEGGIEELKAGGFGVVLAHPERAPSFHRDIDRLARLVAGGVLCSITAGSLVGRFGGVVRRFTAALLGRGLVHDIASDAHDALRRSPEIGRCLAAAEPSLPGLEEQARWLTEDAPAAILAGRPLPAAPPPPKARASRLSSLLDRVRH